MAAVALQLFERRHRRFKPLDGFQNADEPQVLGRGHGKKVEPDVGGRGAMSNRRKRDLLEVVGRQMVLRRIHKSAMFCALRSSDNSFLPRARAAFARSFAAS